MNRDTDGHIILTKTFWDPLDPSVEINAPRHWTPALVVVIVIVIISNIKTVEYKYKKRKRPAYNRTDGQTDGLIDLWADGKGRTDGRTDGRTYYAPIQGI